jgi:hypothetical protein
LVLTALILWSPWGKNGENIETFHFYYLLLAALIWVVSFRFFGGRFVRPKWKQAGKLIAYMTISFVFLTWVGHYAVIIIVGHQALGGLGHYLICKKHGITFGPANPWKNIWKLPKGGQRVTFPGRTGKMFCNSR